MASNTTAPLSHTKNNFFYLMKRSLFTLRPLPPDLIPPGAVKPILPPTLHLPRESPHNTTAPRPARHQTPSPLQILPMRPGISAASGAMPVWRTLVVVVQG